MCALTLHPRRRPYLLVSNASMQATGPGLPGKVKCMLWASLLHMCKGVINTFVQYELDCRDEV